MNKRIELKTYQAGLLQAKAYRRLKNFMADNLSRHGLTMMEWSLLGHVYDAGETGVRTSSLADEFDVEASLLTNMVNAMEKRGLVKRVGDPEDKRAKLVAATGVGREMVEKIEQELRVSMRSWLKPISRRDLWIYIKVLRRVAHL